MWRGGRVVEGARLESVYRGNSIMGSNPILSAIYILKQISPDQKPLAGLIFLGLRYAIINTVNHT